MKMILKTLQETRLWAANFAHALRAPCTIALHGDIGMGKTEIARVLIQELCGIDTIVPSPTFTLVQSYAGKHSRSFWERNGRKATETGIRNLQISHFDLYRITDSSELEEIGLGHAIANDITIIEWPEVAAHLLPPDTIHVYISEEGNGRKIEVNKTKRTPLS